MSDLLAARAQMAVSLGFHIIFAVVGMALPLLMIIAEAKWIRTGKSVYRELARRWARGTAILFAVGAVSGTVLSFELGLLWPEFMRFAGSVIGMPFSLEGFAFFLEAIFLGIYLYGWDRVSPRVHWLAGLMVLISGTMSGVFVVCVNAWMNTPVGFNLVGGEIVDIDPWAAMFNPAAFNQCLHMVLASFTAVGFAVAGIHSFKLLRNRQNLFHRKAIAIALVVGGFCSIAQLVSGDLITKFVARYQPIKLAALEGHWETESNAPLRIGGWPDEAEEETRFAIEIPGGLSFLAFGDPDAVVLGLSDVPPNERPPVAAVHIAFQIMVGCGMLMAFIACLGGFMAWRRKRLPDSRWFLWSLVAAAPLGFIAIEAGWTVTELGRQPWVVYGIMRTSHAVTPMPNLVVPFATFSALYLFLAVVVVILLRRQVFASPTSYDDDA
jgi:cytochrome d ubiquinol oxidase subunit I